MSKRSSFTFNIFLAIILNDVVDGFGQMLMKKGLIAPAAFPLGIHEFTSFIIHNVASPLLWLGIFFYSINFFLWIVILSRIDLSLAVPLGSASYIVIPVLAMIFLHEQVTLLKWFSILLIMIGIFFLSQSKSTFEESVIPP